MHGLETIREVNARRQLEAARETLATEYRDAAEMGKRLALALDTAQQAEGLYLPASIASKLSDAMVQIACLELAKERVAELEKATEDKGS